ncbi:MAG: NAD(P)/FAD-dependent oxidoreductase [Oscillospiraceae bacterium]|nr:NAD(P)/FAD-dependent oxidoreductase [Oscillospiraceae bacterium]MDY2510423.1 NAD(P)/FAD-dependent oxidoreductase [Ruminococcus callidus]
MKKVVIIGAGPAGLTAAYELLRRAPKDYEVTILEESDAIGGISKTVKYKNNRMDIGGHRFFSKDQQVMDWWQEMMPRQGKPSFDDIKLHREKQLAKDGPDPEKTDRVMLVRNRVSRIYYKHKFFDYPVSLKWNTLKNMGFATTVAAGCSYLKSSVGKKEETSLENFYINRFGRKLYSMFFEGYTEKLWGRHPREISADWGSQRVKGLSITAVIKDMFSKLSPNKKNRKVETSLIEEFYYPKYGPGQLWETTAAEIKKLGGKILMHSKVTNIQTDKTGKILSLKYTQDGKEQTMDGDLFISSMPLKDLVAGMNDVPDKIAAIAKGLPYRDFVTVGLLVDKLNLKNETKIPTLGNIVPDCWIYVQDVGVKLGRIQIFNNWSPYMVEDPEHTVWIGLEYFCAEDDSFWNMDDKACINMAIKELVSMGVINSASDVKDSHREKVKKAYPAYFDTYAQIDDLIAYLNQFDNLYCVGRNGQHRYNNMDHSMATSFEAVDNILSGKKTKDNIWSVNTEKEYHEEKKSE